jgi:hypothetical protein
MSDTDIHSCGYYCDRPACIVAQRDELRDKLFEGQAVKTYSGGKPNYTQPEEKIAEFKFQNYGWWKDEDGKMQLGTFPPKKEWVGLTDEEAKEVWKQLNYDLNHGKFADDDSERHVIVELCRAIEAKLKEKNT